MSDIPSLSPSPSTDASAPPESAAPVPPPKAPKRWRRYLIYTLALLGVLLLALVAIVVYENGKPKLTAIDETETIDSVMSRNYGRYSDEHKGWLYVGEGNRTYLVRVVQQAKPADGPNGEELYFVTSGAPLDGAPGALYGVFQVRAGSTKEDAGKLFEISSPHRYEGTTPLTPENVRFEALSENLWAWVIKVQDGSDPKLSLVTVNNVVLAPRGDDIAVLAWFKGSLASDPGIDCAAAETRFQTWAKGDEQPEAVAGGEDEPANSGHEEESMPLRCNDARWSYRTAPVAGAVPVPLTITAKGVRDGVKLEEKTWKLVFDSKAFAYHVPAALSPE